MNLKVWHFVYNQYITSAISGASFEKYDEYIIFDCEINWYSKNHAIKILKACADEGSAIDKSFEES